MNHMELTEREIELLCAVYPCEDLIREGRLLPNQQQALELLRAGSAWLAARYPEEEIRILSFTPGNQFAPWAELRFCCGEGETVYTVVMEPEEDGCRCADTLCTARIRPAYDALVEQTLQRAGFPALSLTVFPNPAGKEFPTDGSVEALLLLAPRLKRNTRLFLPAAYDREGLREELHAALREAGLYGSYGVAFADPIEGQDAARLNESWGALPHFSFNCFDVG